MSRGRSNVARLGPPDPVLVSYFGSDAAAPPSVTLYVLTGGSLKNTRSGVLTRTEFARFILPLESNGSLSLMKILFGALSMIREDAVFLLLVVKASTVVSSLSAIRTSLRTVVRTLFPLKISSFIPLDKTRL